VPSELALAEAHADFAELLLEEGDFLRARELLRLASWNAREAMRIAAAPSCAKPAQ
jgi:hypothetical protein